MRPQKIVSFGAVALGALVLAAGPALAEKKYGPGASDTEIKIGQTMPYSGPASAYGTIGKADAAYFAMVNEQGGVNGRKLVLVSKDDGYNPAKAVELVRGLVEQDNVAFLFNTLGTPSNTAIQKYLNEAKVPQLFVATGADKFGDPEHFPWTMGWQPSYRTEARIYAKYILKTKPDAKVAVLYQADDFGKDYLVGLKAVFGDKAAKMIVSEQSYEVTEPTVDSQIVTLQGTGADTIVIAATPKFAAQAMRKVADIGWHPLEFVTNVSISVESVMRPAGLDKVVGVITAAYGKEPTDPTWKDDDGYKAYVTWMKKYYPEGKIDDANNVYGFGVSQTVVQMLKQCGDDLTRENIMKQAASLSLSLPMSLPGVKVSTSPTDFHPIKEMQLQKFDGKTWGLFGEIISGG